MGFTHITLGQPPTCNTGLPPVFPQRLLGPDAHHTARRPAGFLDAAQMPGCHLCWMPARAPVPCAGHLAWVPPPPLTCPELPAQHRNFPGRLVLRQGRSSAGSLGVTARVLCRVGGETAGPPCSAREERCVRTLPPVTTTVTAASATRKGRDARLSSAGPVAMLSSRTWTGSAGPYSSSQSSCWDHGNSRDRWGDRGSVGLTDASHMGGRWRRGALWPGVRLGYEQVQMERLARQPLELPQGARAASRYKTHQVASGGA